MSIASSNRLAKLLGGVVLAISGTSSSSERYRITGDAGVTSPGRGPGLIDQDDGFVDGPSPGVAFAAGVAFGAPVVGAGLAELAEGDGVAAGFGQEVAAVAKHVRTGYTASGKPVRVMISIFPGDTLILQYTIPT
jgi:hypothetical protein